MDTIINHIRKVNKVMIGISILIIALYIVLSIVLNVASGYIGAALQVISPILLILSINKKKYDIQVGYIVTILTSLSAIIIISNVDQMYVMIYPVAIASLYLDTRLFFLCDAVMNVGVFIKLLIGNQIILNFFTTFIIIDTILLIMFYANKWGKDIIKLAMSENQKAKDLLLKQQKAASLFKSNYNDLNADITKCTTNLGAIKDMSSGMVSSIQEIAKGVTGQTESVTKISEMMNETDSKVSDLNQYSTQLADVSANASQVVMEGSQKIAQMDKQMDLIRNAVTKSYQTVNELNSCMDQVMNFLSAISQISSQTNLLALNAAIEAARAGEYGKGFAVVADEVRTLAEQSANTVSQINNIINNIFEKTKNVLEEVSNGQNAAQEGETIVSQVNKSFEKVSLSFKDIDTFISNEGSKIKNMVELFSQITSETENIASISEEHSASTEELMATSQEYNANIESIYNMIQEIQKLSDGLAKVIEIEQ